MNKDTKMAMNCDTGAMGFSHPSSRARMNLKLTFSAKWSDSFKEGNTML